MSQSNSGKLVGVLAGLAMAVLGTAPLVFGAPCGVSSSALCCNAVATNSGSTVTCAAPANTKYEVTINRWCVEVQGEPLRCTTGTSAPFDAASISAGADLGNYISGATIPGLDAGDIITAMRPEVSKTLTVNGGGQAEHLTTDAVACSTGGEQTLILSLPGVPLCSTQPDVLCETTDGFLRVRDTTLGDVTFTAAGLTINFDF